MKLFHFLKPDTPEKVQDCIATEQSTPVDGGTDFLKVSNIHKTFDGSFEVLKGIDFSLNKGEVLSIIGSSGSGKTTLLRCINFLEFADKGAIRLKGEALFDSNSMDLKTMKEEDLRAKRLKFGLVFQQFNLFPQYSVMENLLLAPRLREKAKPVKERKSDAELKEQAIKLLAMVGLDQRADAYPCQLSGGQQQRVAIARALMLSPEILCFDEPTSALDPELTVEVLRVIKQLKAMGSTMIIVTHEMEFAKNVSDRIIYMRNGIIEEQGTPQEIFSSDNPHLKQFLNSGKEI